MSESRQEEILTALWLCAALLAFNCGFEWVGWVLSVKVLFDAICALSLAWKEFKEDGK